LSDPGIVHSMHEKLFNEIFSKTTTTLAQWRRCTNTSPLPLRKSFATYGGDAEPVSVERAVSSAQPESTDGLRVAASQSRATSSAPFRSPVGPLFEHRGVLLRYGMAMLIVGALAAGRVVAVPILGTQAPLLPFAVAVFAVAYVSGLGPALLAIVLSALITTALFTTHYMEAGSAVAFAGHVGIFVILGGLVSLMMHRLQHVYRLQREALAAAGASAARLQLIADSMPALIAYVDGERRYQFTNRAHEEWFGVRSARLRGQNLGDAVGEAAYDVMRPHVDLALAGQRASFEAELAYRDGGPRYVSAHYVPDLDADGVVHGFFALVQDITESRKARQALEAAQRRLSLALRAGRSGTFDWDITSDRSGWSAELLELHGFKSGDFAGSQQEWQGCIHPEDREHVLASFENASADDEVVLDYRIRRHDTGEVRWLHCRGRVTHDALGHPARMVGINVDITEQKRAEEALRDADRRKDEFLAMLAHELRNPLAPIRYVAHLLAHENADLKIIRRNGDILLRQVNHLVRLLDDLLDAARISRGKIEIRREPLNAETALQRAMEAMQPMLGAKRQTLRYTPSPSTLPLLGDPIRLEQVFFNLLSNASKYSPEHAPIHVSAGLEHGRAMFRVRDEGAGIEASMLTRVFDLFLQADQSLDRPQGGLGIGLTIVKRVVELHGGRVEARSEGLGRGSEFVVELPLATAEQPAAQRARDYQVVARRVLVVEDNDDSAQMLCALLRSDGHQVSTAHDGGEALNQLDSFAPDWVLMDIGLPGMDGYAVVGIMRQRNSGKSARIYALTGYGHPEDRDMALRSGFDGHLTKPVDPDNLLRLLSEAPQHLASRSRLTRH
jgi:PAS domain S-box-containing protein